MTQAETGSSPRSAARPLAELLRLATPTVAQMASYTVMQFIDTWMLAHVGATSATAAANSGLLAFSIISFGMGVLWVVNTLASQSFGARDYSSCGKYLWQGVWFAVVFSLLLLATLPGARLAFVWMKHEPALAALEATYFRIVIPAALIKLVGTAFQQFLLATDRPGRVLASTAGGIAVNAAAAAVLIFGVRPLGIAALGVAGSAWAQNIGVAVEAGLAILLASSPAQRRLFAIDHWWPDRLRMGQLIRIGTPAGVQLIADVLAWSLFSLSVLAPFGTDAMAANTFMMRYMVVSFMPAFGMSTAVTALVGRYLGAGRPAVAVQRTRLAFRVTAAYMLGCGAVFFLGRHALIGLFTSDVHITAIGAKLLTFAAIYQFFDAMYIVYNGALRGAGDTLVPAVATGVLNWSMTVAGGFWVARHLPRFGPGGPWTVATIYGMTLGLFMFLRFRRESGQWLRVIAPVADWRRRYSRSLE